MDSFFTSTEENYTVYYPLNFKLLYLYFSRSTVRLSLCCSIGILFNLCNKHNAKVHVIKHCLLAMACELFFCTHSNTLTHNTFSQTLKFNMPLKLIKKTKSKMSFIKINLL